MNDLNRQMTNSDVFDRQPFSSIRPSNAVVEDFVRKMAADPVVNIESDFQPVMTNAEDFERRSFTEITLTSEPQDVADGISRITQKLNAYQGYSWLKIPVDEDLSQSMTPFS